MSTKTREQIRQEREALDAQEQELRDGEVAAVRAEVERLAAADGMSSDSWIAANLTGASNAKRKSGDKPRRGVAKPEYVHPHDPTTTWSKKGAKPAWLIALEKEWEPESLKVGGVPRRRQHPNGQAHA